MPESTCIVDNCERPSATKNGAGTCKACRLREWRNANPALVAAQRERNKAAKAIYAKAHREAHASEYKAFQAAYYLANSKRVSENGKRWAATNADRNSEIRRQAQSRRRALERGGIVLSADYGMILAKFGMVCHLCSGEIGSRADLHFDHVIPLSKGGAHSPENIRPSHASCNMHKSNRTA